MVAPRTEEGLVMTLVFLILALVAFIVAAVLAFPRVAAGAYWGGALALGLVFWVAAQLVGVLPH